MSGMEPDAGETRQLVVTATWNPCVHGGGWWVAKNADGVDVLLSSDLPTAWNTRTPDPAQIRADALREALECAPEPEPADYDEYDLHGRFNEGFDAGLNFARSRILALLDTPLSPTAVDGSPAPDAGMKGQKP